MGLFSLLNLAVIYYAPVAFAQYQCFLFSSTLLGFTCLLALSFEEWLNTNSISSYLIYTGSLTGSHLVCPCCVCAIELCWIQNGRFGYAGVKACCSSSVPIALDVTLGIFCPWHTVTLLLSDICLLFSHRPHSSKCTFTSWPAVQVHKSALICLSAKS